MSALTPTQILAAARVLVRGVLAKQNPDAAVIACVASARNPGGRLALARRLGLPDERWATVVHPSAAVPAGTELGPGTVLLAGSVITTPLRVGAFVLAMPHVLLTHDDEVADGELPHVGAERDDGARDIHPPTPCAWAAKAED